VGTIMSRLLPSFLKRFFCQCPVGYRSFIRAVGRESRPCDRVSELGSWARLLEAMGKRFIKKKHTYTCIHKQTHTSGVFIASTVFSVCCEHLFDTFPLLQCRVHS
jgi:hypothetical protein